MSRVGWSIEEIGELDDLLDQKRSITDIAELLGRSGHAVRSKIRRLGWDEVDERLHERVVEERTAEKLKQIVRRIDQGISPTSLRLSLTRMVNELEGGGAA